MRHQIRTCEKCGKRRVGAYYMTKNQGSVVHASNAPFGATSGTDPRWWPLFHGWMCRACAFAEFRWEAVA